MQLSETAQKALNAYGGRELWQQHTHIEAEVSVTGLAFVLKRRPFFHHAQLKMAIHQPFSKLIPIGKRQEVAGVLDGPDVRLEDKDGQMLAKRISARQYFPLGRRLFAWDDLDMAYFANYAFWNYLTLPNLLMHPDIVWAELDAGVLRGTFPDRIPTHSPTQTFQFDRQTGLLRQHNYTAEIISRFATAAHVIRSHGKTDALIYPNVRVVTPQGLKGNPLKWPVLIDIAVHRLKLTRES